MINVEFIITSLIVVIIPGTGVIYTISNGLLLGRRAGIAAAFGCTLGILPHLCAGIIGLSAIMHSGALAFKVLKIAGSVYLLYMAWAMWRETGRLELKHTTKRNLQKPAKIIIRGIVINILNPKLTIFFLAFLPLFLSKEPTIPIWQMLHLSVVFMAMTLIVFLLYGLMAGVAGVYINSRPKLIRRIQQTFAAVFVGSAAKLLFTD